MSSDFNDIIGFIRSTFQEPTEFIPLHEPRFIGNEKKYLLECIDSNFVSSVGEFVSRFENMCAEYTGAKYAVAVMNGTAALHLALLLAGVRKDEEVITQALTFIATANAISYTGAHPVFLDVDKDTLGLSPKAVTAWLEENVEMREAPSSAATSPKASYLSPLFEGTEGGGFPFNKHTGRHIAACVPMHTFGHPVKLEELQEILEKYNIPLVEDSAESIGSYYSPREILEATISQGEPSEIREGAISRGKDKHTGTFGKLGILSFNGNKLITTGGGGMILTDNEELAKKAKHLTTQAKVPHAWEFVHDHIGYNYRLTNVNAALGCAQMESLDYLLQLKRKLAGQYKEFFRNTEFEFFTEPENCKSNYWLNAIIVKDRNQRDELLEYTNKNGIMTRPIWELMNRLPMPASRRGRFANCQTDDLKNSIWFADRVVNIPSSAIIPGYGKCKKEQE